MGRSLIAPLTGLILVAWPVLVWLGVRQQALSWLVPGLGFILLLRLWSLYQAQSQWRLPLLLVTLGAGLLVLASLILDQQGLLLYYPVVVNSVFFILFASSLWRGSPIIERIARWQTPTLPPQAIRYTRQVTWVWTGFFCLNGTIALESCWSDDLAWWALWNGMIAYGLMGLLMLSEYIVRLRVMRQITP